MLMAILVRIAVALESIDGALDNILARLNDMQLPKKR